MTRRVLVAVISLALVAFGATACKSKPKVVDNWPKASSERKVAKPAEAPKWPLTGLAAPSDADIHKRIVSIKIENSPSARPQSGIQGADVVYESVAEGGITRFNCLFQSQTPDPVGPVRSARLSDTTIVPEYKALFVYSGANTPVTRAIHAGGLQVLNEDNARGLFRSSKRQRPHNLYAHLTALRADATRLGLNSTAEVQSLAFDAKASKSATPTVVAVEIPFSQSNDVRWEYNPATDTYLRWNNGKPHVDTDTGKQVSSRNVVVIWARYIPQTKTDVAGSITYDIELAGSGRVSVFRNGQRFDGTWTGTKQAPPVFKADDGTQIKLAPGNTWMQVINTSVNISMR